MAIITPTMMGIPEFHPETYKGLRGDTYSFWWSHNGTKHRSERYKSRDRRDVEMAQARAKYATNVSPKLTSLSDDQLKEAELARKYADDHSIAQILDALDYYHKHYRSALKGPALAKAMEDFRKFKVLQNRSERTLKEYDLHFKILKQSFGDDFPTGTLTKDMAEDYLTKNCSGKSLLTYSHHRRTMAALWQWLVDQEKVTSNPLLRIPNPNNNGQLSRGKTPKFYTVDEVKELLKAARKTDLIGFFVLSLFAGIRSAEIKRLEDKGGWKNVDFETGRITIAGKTEARQITMNDTLRAWLKAIEKAQKPFFSRAHWYHAKKIKQQVLSADRYLLPNLARHTYITYALNLPGASYAVVSRNCGNSESVIKKHYEGNVTGSQAEAFFALTPKRIR